MLLKKINILLIAVMLCSNINAQQSSVKWRGVYAGTTTFAPYDMRSKPLLSASVSTGYSYKRFAVNAGFIMPVFRKATPFYSLNVNYKILGK